MADQFLFVGGQEYQLAGSGCTSTATSITLKSLKHINPASGSAENVTMSHFGDIGFATLAPKTSKAEFISFTGITQNADGTATLTGVSKGLTPYTPYTTSSTYKHSHAGGTILIFSNSPAFYNELSGKDNDETITGLWTFTTSSRPKLTTDANATVDEELITKGELSRTALGTTTVNRVVEAATAGETVAAGNLLYFDETDNEWKKCDADTAGSVNNVKLGIAQGAGTDGASISGGVLTFGSDSNQSGGTQGDIAYASNTAGGITSGTPGTTERAVGIWKNSTTIFFDPYFYNYITKNQKDALVGTSGTPSSSNKFVTNDDVASAATASKVARRNSTGDVTVPTTPTASTDAASKSYVDSNSGEKITTVVTSVSLSNDATETNLFSQSISGGTLSSSNAIRFQAQFSDIDIANSHSITFKLKYGATTVATLAIANNSGGAVTNLRGFIEGYVIANASTSAQKGGLTAYFGKAEILTDSASAGTSVAIGQASGTASEDSTSSKNLVLTAQNSNASAATGFVFEHAIIEKIR